MVNSICNSVTRVIQTVLQNRWYKRAILSALFVATMCLSLIGNTQALPDSWIRPMEAVIKYQRSSDPRPEDLQPKGNYHYKRQGQGILTAIQGKAYAKLEFRQKNKIFSPLVSVGLDKKQTTNYYLPCPAVKEGTAVIGWSFRKAGSNGCSREVIAYLQRSSKKNPVKSSAKQQAVTSKQSHSAILLADNSAAGAEKFKISPLQDVTLILVRSRLDEVTVDVLMGEVAVDSGVSPLVKIAGGQRYTYTPTTGGSITQSPADITNSPPVQSFLDSTGWSPEAQPVLADFRLSASSQPAISDTAKQLLAAHNRCRARVGVPPLKWSNEIAAFAQQWADTRPSGHRSDRRGYGENMAWGQSIDSMVEMWCNEKARYESNPKQCLNSYDSDKTCLHFSQVVWSRSKEVGCGIAPEPRYGNVLVCNYNPPGNYRGELPY